MNTFINITKAYFNSGLYKSILFSVIIEILYYDKIMTEQTTSHHFFEDLRAYKNLIKNNKKKI